MIRSDRAKTILLVEDEGVIALAESKTLQDYGFKVIIAPSGEKAVDVFKASPEIDLVLMDINLGSDMDGTQAAEIILAERELPLIFLSSHTERDVVEKTDGITSYGYVVKGSGETVLIASIKMAFRLFDARTQERLKDEALQHSEHQLKIITDTIPAYVAYVGLDDLRYRFVNTRFVESYKLPRNQIIGSHIKDIIGQSNYEFAQQYLDIVRQGKSTAYENSFVTAGTERWVNVNYVPELNEKGEADAVVVLSFDITDRKRVENQLKEREERLRMIFDTMTEGVALNENVYDENGEMIDYRVLEVNNVFYSVADLHDNNVLGNVATKLYGMTPEFIKAFWEDHKKKDSTAYTELFRPDSKKWYAVATSPFYDDKFVTSFMDITEQKRGEEKQKQVEQALRESEARLKIIFEQANDAIHISEVNGEIIEVNQRLCELMGYTREQLLSMRVSDLQAPEKRVDSRVVQAEIEQHGNSIFEGLNIHRDGRYIPVEISVSRIESPQGDLFISILRDITKRIQVEKALRESEEKFRTLIDKNPIPLCFVNDREELEYINQGFIELFGYDHSDILTLAEWWKQAYPDDAYRQWVQKIWNSAVEKSTRSHTDIEAIEYRVTCKNGKVLNVEIAGIVLENGILATFIDVTARKHAEEARAKSFEEKQNLLRELQHRAKNSFSMISSLTRLMADTNQSEEARVALVELGERVKALTELYDLLYITESVTETQLDEYCARIAMSFPSLDVIRFKQEYEPVTVPVKTAASIGLILTELITNAIKHAFPESRRGMISISLRKSDENAALEVADDGRGLPEGFELTASHTLGLTIIQSLTQQIHGSFRIECEEETRCIVEFPIDQKNRTVKELA